MRMTRREFGLATSGAALVLVAGCGGEERALVVPEGSGLKTAILNAKGMH
jgi:hypothetical protein